MLRITILMFIGILGYGFCSESNTIISSSTVRPIKDKYINTNPPDILTKRNIQVQELSKSSFEPSREYYRNRPSYSGSSYDRNRDKDVIVGYNTVSNTIAVADRPSTTYHQQLSVTPAPPSPTTNSYGNEDEDNNNNNKYSPSKGGTYWNIDNNKNKKFQDRLSIGHPGINGNYLNSGVSSGGPYGQPIPVHFNGHYSTTGGQYHSSNTGREHGHGYDLSHKGYDDYSEYGHSGGGYSSYGHGNSGGGDELYGKIALAKKYLIPIAGIAVLGVAAALIANPLLLQLGTISSPFGKKRRRRDLHNEQNINNLNAGQNLAYKGYNKNNI